MSNYYQLKFETEAGKTITLSVPNAKVVTTPTFTSIINQIIDSEAVKTTSGLLTRLIAANLCVQTVTALDVKTAE